jgi:hypothetical protein
VRSGTSWLLPSPGSYSRLRRPLTACDSAPKFCSRTPNGELRARIGARITRRVNGEKRSIPAWHRALASAAPVRERPFPNSSDRSNGPELIGSAMLPKPTIVPWQIEQTFSGVIVAPVRPGPRPKPSMRIARCSRSRRSLRTMADSENSARLPQMLCRVPGRQQERSRRSS